MTRAPDEATMIEIIRAAQCAEHGSCHKGLGDCSKAAITDGQYGIEGCCFYADAVIDVKALMPYLQSLNQGSDK